MREKIKKISYNLLKRSEKWTKTDMIYLAEGGFWLTAGQIVSSASAFLLAIAFANLLPQEVYGNYKYVLSLAGILAIPTLSGINTAIVQAVARGYEGSVIPALKTKIKWGLLGGLAGLGLAFYYYLNDNNVLAISFLIVAIFTPIMDPLILYRSYLKGRKKFKKLSKYNIYNNIIASIIIVAVVYFTKNLFLIIISYFLANIIIRLILTMITIYKEDLNANKDKETILYGKHLSFMTMFNKGSSYVDKLLIFHYIGAPELAIYSIAVAPVEQLRAMTTNINILALPKFSSTKIENIKKTLKSKIFKMMAILTLIALVYIFLAPFIYKIFFSQYLESIIYSQVFAISLILTGPIGILLVLLNAKKKKAMLYQYNIAKPVIKIILLFVFVKYLGIMGIIIATILSYIFELIFLSTRKIN